MIDISGIQAQWQKEISPIQEEEKQAIYKKHKYLAKLELIGEKYNDAKGLRRLQKPFVISTKAAWLRHRKMKIEKYLEEKESQIKDIAVNTLSRLTDAVARSSARGAEYAYLETTITQIQYTQDIVQEAAKKCRNASAMEGAAAVGDAVDDAPLRIRTNNNAALAAGLITIFASAATDFAANRVTRNAARAFHEAEAAVKNLQVAARSGIPLVNGEMASELAASNSTAGMMDTFGSMTESFSNWAMANQLQDAKSHLNSIAEQLGNTMDMLSRDKTALAEAAIADARKNDNNINNFAAELEYQMLPLSLRRPLEDTLMADKEIPLPTIITPPMPSM